MNNPELTVAIDARLISSHNTGDTSYWRGLISGLAQIDHNFKFLLCSNTSQPEIVPNDPRFEWHEISAIHPKLWSLNAFPKFVHKINANLVHGQYNMSPRFNIPVITTIHDVSFMIQPNWFQPKDRILLQKHIPSTVKRATKVITVSNTSKAEIEQYFPFAKGKVEVTYNALGNNITSFSKEKAEEIVQTELGIKLPYILTIGYRWPRKNLNLAVEAVESLPENTPYQLVITGKKGWGEEKETNRTHYTGYVSDEHLSALYSAASLYLAPSLHEGFGIPLLEAFATNCPVICGKGGAMLEVAGDAAVIAPNYDASTWTALITETLADSGKLETLKQKGLKRVQDFSWKKTAQKTLEIYRESISH